MHVTSNMDAAWPSEGDDSAVRGITGTHRYEFPFRISKKKKTFPLLLDYLRMCRPL